MKFNNDVKTKEWSITANAAELPVVVDFLQGAAHKGVGREKFDLILNDRKTSISTHRELWMLARGIEICLQQFTATISASKEQD